LDRRQFLRAGALAGAGVLAGPFLNRGRFSLFADDRVEHSARAVELVGRSMVIDMLGLLTLDWPKLYAWQREPGGFGPVDLQKLQRSGVNVFHPAVEPNEPHPYEATRDWIAGWNRLLATRSDCFLRIDGARDLQRVREEGKAGILVGFQNSDHFRTVEDVQRFHALGQRVSQLTYNARNRLGCGCRESRDTGLTAYGAQIVEAMNRAGMAVDVSHCSERTCLDAFTVSRRPVLVTHSNCRALAANPRCKSDEVIRAMAARGGVMGITVVPAFVSSRQPATIEHVLDHFDRVARLAGVEHVGLGSDVDLDAVDPRTGRVRSRYDVRGLVQARRVFDLTEGLIRRGYGERSIELILGGNFQRALDEIWKPERPRDLTPGPSPEGEGSKAISSSPSPSGEGLG
jgi:membrane dipeptidase